MPMEWKLVQNLPPLSQDEIKELVDYNPETGKFVWNQRDIKWFGSYKGWAVWNSKYSGKEAGTLDSYGYRKLCISYRHFSAHRLAWFVVHGEWPEMIDHINGHKDDNRIDNLRIADKYQNAQNGIIRLSNKSGYKGVSKSGSRWRATIINRGMVHCLGAFLTPEEAHQAYCKAAEELHGEFARTV